MKWIAVDYGERRTGLAVCDASELIVTPVTPQIEEKSLNKVAEAAAAARLAQGAEGVVCGLPRNMDGTEGSRCVKSRRFAARLATACGVPVVLWDERRTTVTAAGILSANSTFGADRKARLDSVSAAVILESFLAWRKAHPGEEPPELVRPEQKEENDYADCSCPPLPHPCGYHCGRQPPLGQAAHAARQRGPQGRL